MAGDFDIKAKLDGLKTEFCQPKDVACKKLIETNYAKTCDPVAKVDPAKEEACFNGYWNDVYWLYQDCPGSERQKLKCVFDNIAGTKMRTFTIPGYPAGDFHANLEKIKARLTKPSKAARSKEAAPAVVYKKKVVLNFEGSQLVEDKKPAADPPKPAEAKKEFVFEFKSSEPAKAKSPSPESSAGTFAGESPCMRKSSADDDRLKSAAIRKAITDAKASICRGETVKHHQIRLSPLGVFDIVKEGFEQATTPELPKHEVVSLKRESCGEDEKKRKFRALVKLDSLTCPSGRRFEFNPTTGRWEKK